MHLTKAVLDEARDLLESICKISTEPDVTTIEHDREQLAKSEAALWAWYLEWSRIARIAVTPRAHT